MYQQFFGLSEAPFSITPDPAFVYLSPEHRDALAHLLYGVGQGGAGGFVQLTGEVGTGKTTLCRCLLQQLPEDTHAALVLNPLLTPAELLATICEELGIDTDGIAHSNKAMVDALNAYLLAQHARGHRVVVVIDEAQNLSPESLEQVRLLTNLETTKEKLLQMVLLGQPELRQLLQRQNLRQLAQRITARYHLQPLGPEDTRAYVRHRMMVAGAQRSPFSRSALRALYQRSAGVPRLINIIADRALAGAYARESSRVTARLVHAAADEVQPSEKRVRTNPWRTGAAALAGLALVVVSLVLWGPAWLEPAAGLGDTARQPSEPRTSDRSESLVADPIAGSGDVSQIVQPAGPALAMEETPVGGPAPGLQAIADEPPTVEDLLDEEWLDLQHVAAWRSLARTWQRSGDADAIKAACNGMPGTGFACLRDSGSWSRIRQLGLPVLLVLRGEGDRLLLLTGLEGDSAQVGALSGSRTVLRSRIEDQWLGDYVLAWPQAPDWPSEIRRGDSGSAVEIVIRMASLGNPPWRGGNRFDEGFEAWVLEFQRRHGLQADGIIGPHTLVHLIAPTITEPRLGVGSEEDS
ncbi:MAG: AAA family ATPase [Gammaproteobacteria bacterium]|nr:AAA family ATPase [Gammaproteobacteria bacterium]MBT8055829.1 AAA family ATPase [Gammaproteobacteria bacterium]